ncbi:Zn-dependent hydrolase [Amycolatopsis acidiphila]|uniref:Zn-dependent hydrolase n=1 Tax=Amycolatopsis acidiphila TaxID=715473 RepID=A0A558AJ00_9PSEU|nr:Zn-dependent hydrolase [Amycolatopsis acidiphila]TVT24242.1 Zn-dependent hydrolase [Amycolatopsis acidiphila]UIJ62627.1 Zn-dependent hydrolase [Amycolatopsis acidiphila]GHG85840.1 Zn-dependent hydrolase [Amycolatopsis acidiphila]
MSESLPEVSPHRMAELVTELGRVGEQPGGGLIRFVYDDAWRTAGGLLAHWMAEAGLEVRTDAVGNVFGRLAGTESEATVLTGSHFDTVPMGGRYDGALGVLSGLAALEALSKTFGRPKKSLEVVALCEEESSRFPANFFGSRAMLGTIADDEPETLHDADGMTLADAMTRIGLDPRAIGSARRNDVEAFVELHIEQGRVLQDEGTRIGIVTAITGLRWLDVTVSGRADHAGATPMDLRRDAMQGAAEMTQAVTALVEAEGRPAVATCGAWQVLPGGVNIVPEQVTFSIDLRHPDEATLDRLAGRIRQECARIATRRQLAVALNDTKLVPPAPMDESVRALIEKAAAEQGASARPIPSGAGHDSQMWAPHVPTAMIFVPSVDGRSHCPEEYTAPEDCAVGASVLAGTLRELAY